MTKIAATFPDAERVTRDLLATLLVEHEPDVTVGVGLPGDWTPKSPPHLEIQSGGVPISEHRIMARATMRVIAHAGETTRAKELAELAAALLCAHTGGMGVVAVRTVGGVTPARDPDTKAELASVILGVTIRSEAIE